MSTGDALNMYNATIVSNYYYNSVLIRTMIGGREKKNENIELKLRLIFIWSKTQKKISIWKLNTILWKYYTSRGSRCFWTVAWTHTSLMPRFVPKTTSSTIIFLRVLRRLLFANLTTRTRARALNRKPTLFLIAQRYCYFIIIIIIIVLIFVYVLYE